jgi:hypothetical protein
MNYYQAHNILDEVRQGAQYSEAMINTALELTGDYGFSRFEKKNNRTLCPTWNEQGMDSVYKAQNSSDGKR